MIGIYCIENIVNNKKYIGKSKDVDFRLNYHKRKLLKSKHCNKYLQDSWNKYGEESFKFYFLDECDINELNIRGKYYIEKLNTKAPDGYNLTSGGDGLSCPSNETRKKISESQKGLPKVTEERKEKQRIEWTGKGNPNFGKHLSYETKLKLSKSLIGRNAPNRNISPTEDVRRKMSEAKIGKKQKIETIEKRIRSNQGKLKNLKHNKESKFVGVWKKKMKGLKKCWIAEIRYKNIKYRSSHYTEIDAAKAYDKKALELFGENAKLNFPQKF